MFQSAGGPPQPKNWGGSPCPEYDATRTQLGAEREPCRVVFHFFEPLWKHSTCYKKLQFNDLRSFGQNFTHAENVNMRRSDKLIQ